MKPKKTGKLKAKQLPLIPEVCPKMGRPSVGRVKVVYFISAYTKLRLEEVADDRGCLPRDLIENWQL
jgi:hypothetical protein